MNYTSPRVIRGGLGQWNSPPLTDIDGLGVAALHSCLWQRSGRVRCWGSGVDGRAGNGVDLAVTPRPVDAGSPDIYRRVYTRTVGVLAPDSDAPLLGVRQLARSLGYHSCAILDDGRAVCWGSNNFGQLGDGSETPRARPVWVRGPDGADHLRGVVSLSLGVDHSCAVVDTGAVYCWGNNTGGQLGTGTAGGSVSVPQLVATL
ncbi:MAG: RCC1 domain-containing protein [Polyangiales bacterium]